MSALLEVRGISKRFPGVVALHDVHFALNAGEVLALVGENGAGKSTLMKILSGIYQRDSGDILIDGNPVWFPNPAAAQLMGISIIHQEMNLVEDLSVAENIFLGREPRRGPFLLQEQLHRQTTALLDYLGIDLDPRATVRDLNVASQQMVEIAKALSTEARVLIMDEPTSSLTTAEVETLFRLIDGLRARGTGIIYISHRMEELQRLADRVTVLRDGTYVGSLERHQIDIGTIIEMMVGRPVDSRARPPETTYENREIVLGVRGLRTKVVAGVDFDLYRGEILGFAGLMGAGRTETARAIIGADRRTAGTIQVHQRFVSIKQPADAVRLGIGYLSEDRKGLGLMLEQSVTTNTVLASLARFCDALGIVDDRRAAAVAQQHVTALRTKTPSVAQPVKLLSGGNQQKVVLAKWLTRDVEILIVDEPTRGIDVGAKEEIYRLLRQLADAGKSIIVISSELPEVLRLSDRIAVMAQGRIAGMLTSSEATQQKIMDLATSEQTNERGQSA